MLVVNKLEQPNLNKRNEYIYIIYIYKYENLKITIHGCKDFITMIFSIFYI